MLFRSVYGNLGLLKLIDYLPDEEDGEQESIIDKLKKVTTAGGIVIPIWGGVVGPAFSFSYNPATKQVCVGAGLGATIPPTKVANAGPLISGDVNETQSILQGTSITVNVQTHPARGFQIVTNVKKSVSGPSVATSPGASLAVTYSRCFPKR